MPWWPETFVDADLRELGNDNPHTGQSAQVVVLFRVFVIA